MIASSRICFAALVSFGWYAACVGQTYGQAEDASQLASNGELRAALIASNPVLVTPGADGQLGGVSVELARALASKLNVPVRLILYDGFLT
jgi:ABC-type amino acid transport substrate-binding protein